MLALNGGLPPKNFLLHTHTHTLYIRHKRQLIRVIVQFWEKLRDMRVHKLVCLNEIRDSMAVCRPACTWIMVIITKLCGHLQLYITKNMNKVHKKFIQLTQYYKTLLQHTTSINRWTVKLRDNYGTRLV